MTSHRHCGRSCVAHGDLVFQAAADGASSVFTVVEGSMVRGETEEKVRTFIRAAKEAKRLFDAGAGREEIGGRVSPNGRKKFWEHWPE